MNSAPRRTKSAATETRDEIRNSAECTALRAITVRSPARIAASEKIQKKTDSQPDKIIALSKKEKGKSKDGEPNRRFVVTFAFLLLPFTLRHRSYFTVSRPCSSISRFQTKPARE